MNTSFTVLAMSDNQNAWLITLIVGVVVLLVVIALLEGLRRAVLALNEDIWQTWVNGKAVVKNTAMTYLLKNTRDSGQELVEELNHHG
jgi:ABC-type protease/lipase transport system fused ATPase/permease subunit